MTVGSTSAGAVARSPPWRCPPVRASSISAAGTGDLVRLARRAGHQVVGIDLSYGMLAAGRRRGRSSPSRPTPQRLPIADASIDGVVCGYALRNLTDLAASLAEAARVLRPGGRLALLEVAAPAGRPAALRVRPLVRPRGARSSAASCPIAPPTATCPGRSPTSPTRPGCAACCTRRGFATVGRRLLHGGLSQLITATRGGLPADGNGRPT